MGLRVKAKFKSDL